VPLLARGYGLNATSTTRRLPRFQTLQFGSRSAEKESRFSPELLRHSFVELQSVVKKIRGGECFFIIGPKGSGKSAVVEKLALDAEADGFPFFIERHSLGDLPHTLLGKIVPGQESAEASYRRAWKYILYVLMYRSLSNDPSFQTHGALSKSDVDFLLSRAGLLQAASITDIVTKSRSKKLKAAFRGLGAEKSALADYEDIDQDMLYETVRDHVLMGWTDVRHHVCIDGLDRVFSTSPSFKLSISALMGAVVDVNLELLDAGGHATVVALARRDMLELLMTPDLSKYVGDHGVPLEWFDARIEPHVTELWALINRRASISAKQEIDVYRDYLPEKIGDDHTVKYLLDRTRHRPRDLIELMNITSQTTKREKPLPTDISAGYTRYSEEYLLPEVQDELKGFLTREEIDAAFNLLRRVKLPSFSYSEGNAVHRQHEDLSCFDYRKLVSALFNASAIGLLDRKEHGFAKVRFKYRNEREPFNPNYDLIVHHGLRRALNI
jgi:hypothetical protein